MIKEKIEDIIFDAKDNITATELLAIILDNIDVLISNEIEDDLVFDHVISSLNDLKFLLNGLKEEF
tara:strand:- start:1139 stop:1336 length:198 start_codon:yes stop_codon:yes gene_type:complete